MIPVYFHANLNYFKAGEFVAKLRDPDCDHFELESEARLCFQDVDSLLFNRSIKFLDATESIREQKHLHSADGGFSRSEKFNPPIPPPGAILSPLPGEM